ncbi:16S rRNA (guanine(966)-N(2))-methyltransferase RsmD [Pedobacter cryophilus]|uniref:16S rRNA (Guanine(966)-N(2))-methyltransferase RsmD n=1 Tax=Pedobacter cryophilus TaxID=2571271 RepID=A0A4U1C0X0_9SPHI|nr:16S rRNA (guanine(966)-N(2))-methyltransferase RsmD [Pedobacter cryophilus]TKB99238.1 16S rRNA (guanine(966)-N(2))-methyltransferase RsmD [Pedobacter cryophilus]
MRIIGGKLKGLRFNPPKNLPVRPTTDMAKEALFNILQNQVDFDNIKILDLFSGTGSISLEFASREALEITAVDQNFGCVNYLKSISTEHQLTQIKTVKADVFKYLNQETETFDLIFADPPYDIPRIPEIASIIFEKKLLNKNGILIIEHQSRQDLHNHPNFKEKRKYGYSAFSFFVN